MKIRHLIVFALLLTSSSLASAASGTCADLFRKNTGFSDTSPVPPSDSQSRTFSNIPVVEKISPITWGAKVFSSPDMKWAVLTDRPWHMKHFEFSSAGGMKPPGYWILINLTTGERTYLAHVDAADTSWSGVPRRTDNSVVFSKEGFFIHMKSPEYEASYSLDYDGHLLTKPRIVTRPIDRDDSQMNFEDRTHGILATDPVQNRVTYAKNDDTPTYISTPIGQVIGQLPSYNRYPVSQWQPMGKEGYVGLNDMGSHIYFTRDLAAPQIRTIPLSLLKLSNRESLDLYFQKIDYISPFGDYVIASGIRVKNQRRYDEWMALFHINGTVKVIREKAKTLYDGENTGSHLVYDGRRIEVEHKKALAEIRGTDKVVILKSGREPRFFWQLETREVTRVMIVDAKTGKTIEKQFEGYWELQETRFQEVVLVRPTALPGPNENLALMTLNSEGKVTYQTEFSKDAWMFTGNNKYVRVDRDRFLLSGEHRDKIAIIDRNNGVTYREGRIAALSHEFERLVVYEKSGSNNAYVVYDFNFKQQTILPETGDYHIGIGGLYGFLSTNSLYVRQKQWDGPEQNLFIIRW